MGTPRTIGWTVAALVGITACASAPRPAMVPPFAGDVPLVAEADLLGVDPAMRRALEGWPDAPARQQAEELNRFVLHPGSLGFRYVGDQTLTAPEAFVRREGNCVAFANLAVALAREVGLEAFFQEATTLPDWDADGETLVVNRHVNVGIDVGRGVVTLDATEELAERTTRLRRIDDRRAAAHYYNNLGADALLAGDLPYAYAALRRAIEASPDVSFAWSNLGLVLARNGQPSAAEDAYTSALRADPGDVSAMINLAVLLRRQGRDALAERLRGQAERARANDPYYAWALGRQHLAAGRAGEALAHFRRAAESVSGDARLHLALARAYHATGQADAAAEAYAKARRHAPANRMAALRHHESLEAYLAAEGAATNP